MTSKAQAALAVANIPAEARAIAGMMALPIDYPPVRVADTYSADETALAQIVTRQKVSWDSGLNIGQTSTGRQLPSNDWGTFVFPSLLRHTVTYTVLAPGTAALTWRYQAISNNQTRSVSFDVPNLAATWWVEPVIWTSMDAIAPHGDVMFPGVAQNKRGVWVDAMAGYPCTVNITFSAAIPASTNVSMEAYRWTGGNWQFAARGSATNPSTSVTLQILNSGYYAFMVNGDSGLASGVSTYTFTISNSTTSAWAHKPANDVTQNLSSIGNQRVLGLAVLLQNEASVMNKQGNVVAVQSPPNVDWYDGYAGRSGGAQFYSYVFQEKAVSSFLLETGLYGFKRPKGVQDFAWEQEIFQGNPSAAGTIQFVPGLQVNLCAYQLSCPCDYLVVAASASQTGAADCLLNTAIGLEYTTTNTWLETQTPVIAKQAFELGIASLREVEQFYENPIHIPGLMDAISKGMQVMAPLVGFLPGIGPALAAGLGTGSQVIKGVKQALYNDESEDTQAQGGNRSMARKQMKARRMAELATVVADGDIMPTRRRRLR